MRIMHFVSLMLLLVLSAPLSQVHAETRTGYKILEVKQDFESTLFELDNAIVDRGLVVDYTGHVSKMLDRTSEATGGRSPYKDGRYMIFCSAKLSQAAMKADPDNLAICPYVVFIYELKSRPGLTRVGYRRPIASEKPEAKKALAAIEQLLDGIIKDATGK